MNCLSKGLQKGWQLFDRSLQFTGGLIGWAYGGGASPLDIQKIYENQVESVETHRGLHPVRKKWGYIPISVGIHFVVEPKLIRQVLLMPRNGSELEFGHKEALSDLDGHNMLLCPSENHMRLRKPLEVLFSERHLKEHWVPHLAVEAIHELTSPVLLYPAVAKRALGIMRLDPQGSKSGRNHLYAEETLSQAEMESSEKLMSIAGTHTTSTLFSFFLKDLHEHPQWRQVILAEWQEFVEAKGPFEGEESFNGAAAEFAKESKTLQACFKETARLHPIFPIVIRTVKQKMQLGDLEVKTGEQIALNIHGYQRQDIWGVDPHSYNPERFLTSEYSQPPLYTFGVGSQKCIGQYLAELTLKVNMVHLLILTQWPQTIQHEPETYDGLLAVNIGTPVAKFPTNRTACAEYRPQFMLRAQAARAMFERELAAMQGGTL